MKLNKKELVFSIIMVMAILFVGFNLSVFASNSGDSQTINFPAFNNQAPNIIEVVNNTTNNTRNR